MSNIVEGLFIGVGVGLTTAIILAALRLLFWYRERVEQIPYIRDLIAAQAKALLTANDVPHPVPGVEPVHADFIRYAIFRRLQSDLEIAISSRATALKYHEVSALRQVMAGTDIELTSLTLHDRKVLPLDFAKRFYDEVRGLCWLGLPRDLRAESLTRPS